MPNIRIRLLGTFELVQDDRPIAIPQPRLQSLIAYLALNRAAPQARRRLAFLFWPDSSEAQAHANLRRELHDLRGLWPEMTKFLHLDRQSLHWRDAQAVAVDVAEFEARLAEAENASHVRAAEASLRQALELYAGELLPHLYDEWVLAERERLHRRYLGALTRLTLVLEQQGKLADALETAQRLVERDPLQESAYRTVMRLMMEGGDRAGALRVYRSCVAMLREELGVEPDSETERLYRDVVGGSVSRAQRPAHARLDDPPLVGRAAQWAKLQAVWRSAAGGQASFVLIAGESGIGKTRLMEELVGWAQLQGYSTAVTRSYEAEGRLAYAPVTEWLRAEAVKLGIRKLQPVWLTEAARLLPEVLTERPDVVPPEPLVDSWQRQRFREGLARVLLSAGSLVGAPLLLAIDDLQWCDAETLEWLHFLLRYDLRARLLVVGTMRVEAVDPDHPLTTLTTNLRRNGQYTEIVLGPLDSGATAELAAHVRGRALDAEQAASVYAETEGHPLFVVEMLRATETDERLNVPASAPGSGLPPKVQAVIESRLAQLSASARNVAGLAAVVGRAFAVELLREALEETETRLVDALDELFRRHIISEKGADAYDFTHDKLREATYTAISLARRRYLHRRVAEALERLHAANLDAVSSEIATHYEQAGLVYEAAVYLLRAAEVAQRVYAHEEALSDLTKTLALLAQQPERPERATVELEIQLAMGRSLAVLRGSSALVVSETFEKAQEIAFRVGDDRQRLKAFAGLFLSYLTQGNVLTAYETAQRQIAIVGQIQEPETQMEVQGCVGFALEHLGRWQESRAWLEPVVDKPDFHWDPATSLNPVQHPGLLNRRHLVLVLWHLGYPDQALAQMAQTVALARDLDHPYTLVAALSWSAWLYQLCREGRRAYEQAEAAIDISNRLRYPYWVAHCTVVAGWGLAQERRVEEGRERIRHGLAGLREMGAGLHRPALLSMLAEAYGWSGQPVDGICCIDEALDRVEAAGGRFSQAELFRLKGELLAQLGDEKAAEASLQQALEVARRQEAKSLELRAAMSLARFWSRRDRRQDAHGLVAEIYGRFTEGFATPDLQEAKRMLDELA